jgi:pimeloyl-ACP methyl ester carboxylesterase
MTAPFSFRHDGLDFHGIAAGSGPPVVMLHGGGSRASSYAAMMGELADRFRCLAYDMRGFGDTGAPPGRAITHTLWAEDLGACLDCNGIERTFLVGWSLGATVALNYASRYPDRVRAMALLGAPHPNRPINRALFQKRLDVIADGGDAAAVVAATFPAIAAAFSPWTATHRPDAIAQIRAEHLAQDVRLAAAVVEGYASRPDLHAVLPRVACPVTLLVGDADRTCDRAGAEELARRLPQATVRVVADCGHYYPVEQPEAVAAMIAAAFAVSAQNG